MNERNNLNTRQESRRAAPDPLMIDFPSDGDVVLMLGGLYKKHGRVKEAAEIYDRALVPPGLPEAYKARIAARRDSPC